MRSRTNLNSGSPTAVSTSVAAGGTTNTIPKFTGAYTVGDSSLTDNGTTVTATLGLMALGVSNSVAGTLRLFDSGTTAELQVLTSGGVGIVRTATNHALQFGVNGSQVWGINTSFDMIPLADNSRGLGSATNRIQSVFIGTALNLNAAGSGLFIKQGTNATFGTVTLSGAGASAIIYSTKVTASSVIMLTNNATGGTLGVVGITARTASVSATVASSVATDTSTIGWIIVEPA